MEDFKEDSDMKNLLYVRRFINDQNSGKSDENGGIDDEGANQFGFFCTELEKAYNNYSKIDASNAIKNIIQGLEFYKNIPMITPIIECGVIEKCADYYCRYCEDKFDELPYDAVRVLSLLSYQTTEYTSFFAPIIGKLFSSVKTYRESNKLQSSVIDILSNCATDSKLKDQFDMIPIMDFNENYVKNIKTPEECLSVIKFYNKYLYTEAPVDIYQDIFYRIPDILRTSCQNPEVYRIATEIIAIIAENNAIDFEFLIKEDLVTFLKQQLDVEECAHNVIYIFSFCCYFNDNFAEFNPFTIPQLFDIITSVEDSDSWRKRAIVTTHFLAVLVTKKALDEDQMLFCAKWICDGVSEASYNLKGAMTTLMCSIISNCGKYFIENSNITEIFEFLNESILALPPKKYLAFACKAAIAFAETTDKLAIDVRQEVINSEFLNSLSFLIEDSELESPVFESFKQTFE